MSRFGFSLGLGRSQRRRLVTGETSSSTLPTTMQSSVAYRGATYALGGSYPVGTYENGVPFVVAPSGLTISEPSPAKTLSGGRTVNGSMKNPEYGAAQCLDSFCLDGSYVTFDAGLEPTYPLALIVGDVLVKAVSDLAATSGTRFGTFDQAALFVVAEAPLTGTVAPPALHRSADYSPTTRPQSVFDFDAIVAALPSYDVTGLTMRSWADIEARAGVFAPLAAKSVGAGAQEVLLPRNWANQGGSYSNYGRYATARIGELLAVLWSNRYTTAQRRSAAKIVAGHMAQWYYPRRGLYIGADGGHQQWYQGCIAIGLNWLGQLTAQAANIALQAANYTEQPFRATGEFMAQMGAAHSNPLWPCSQRIRSVSSVSGLTITVATNYTQSSHDAYRMPLTGNIMTRVSDGATANVVSTVGDNILNSGVSTKAYNIDAQPGSPFAPGDQVWCECPYPVAHGDMLWQVTDAHTTTRWKWCSSPSTDYMGENSEPQAGSHVLAMCALNAVPASYDAMVRWTYRVNQTNDPAGFDFHSNMKDLPDYAAIFAAHGSAIFTPHMPGDAVAPVISGLSASAFSGTTARITLTTTKNQGSVWVVFTASATQPSAAQILAGLDHTGSPALKTAVKDALTAGAVTINVDGLSVSTTYHIHCVKQDWFGNNSNLLQTSITTPASGTAYPIDWAEFSVGNGNTEVDANGWTFSTNAPVVSFVSDASAPSGKRAVITGSHASVRHLSHDQISAAIAAGGWSEVQILALLRVSTTTNTRGGFGFVHSTTSASGLRLAGNGTICSVDLNTNADPNGAEERPLVDASPDDSLLWVRVSFYATDKVRGKAWTGNLGDEPGSWSTDLAAAAAWAGVLTRFDIYTRTGTAESVQMLGAVVAIDMTAPWLV